LHGDCLDVVAPLLKLGSAVADAAGVASVTFAVPAGLSPGDLLWFQAFWADQADAVLSDVVAGEVEGCPADYDPLTWDLAPTWERSGVADRIVTGAVGDCIADALLLPTDPADVWDDGVYTPPAWAADGLAHGRSWASWDQWGVDCHLFRMTIDVPSCPFSSIRLSSPWYAGIPANDNLYVYINNTAVWYGGTSYGVPRGGPLEVDTYLNPILDFPARFFEPGANELLIVAEEYAAWGGLGYVEPILVP
jgi:hypothetical protein